MGVVVRHTANNNHSLQPPQLRTRKRSCCCCTTTTRPRLIPVVVVGCTVLYLLFTIVLHRRVSSTLIVVQQQQQQQQIPTLGTQVIKESRESSKQSESFFQSHQHTLKVQQQQPHNQDNPISSSSSSSSSFSACLLVMDDNHFLMEWLAYHYFVLPLRYLILAVDPRSVTSPRPILERWRRLMMMNTSSQQQPQLTLQQPLTIVEWNQDSDFMNETEFQQATEHVRRQFKRTNINEQPDLIHHRARQRLFYYKCMLQIKQQQKQPEQQQKPQRYNQDIPLAGNWVVLIDTDEFLHINYPTAAAAASRMESRNNNANTAISLPLLPPNTAMSDPGSVMTFLQAELRRNFDNNNNNNKNNFTSTPCIQIPRLRYAAIEDDKQQQQRYNDPANGGSQKNNDNDITTLSDQNLILQQLKQRFNFSQFQTLRWHHAADALDYVNNRISKTMIDLSRVSMDQLQPVDSIHRPIRELCGHRRLYITTQQQVFVIRHYLGTLEQYLFRNDSRTGKERSRDVYQSVQNSIILQQQQQQQQQQRVTDTSSGNTSIYGNGKEQQETDQIDLWLQGFVQQVGWERALELLRGVGQLQP